MFRPFRPWPVLVLSLGLVAVGGGFLLRARAMQQEAEVAALAQQRALAAMLTAAGTGPVENAENDSRIVAVANGPVVAKGEWGELRGLVQGETRSLKDLLTGVAVLEPGQQIHPPHQHAEEEFLYVAKGEGTWHLNGKESPAHEGDLLFVKPWEMHGLKNTSKGKLTFFVMKWNGRQLPVPEKPAAK